MQKKGETWQYDSDKEGDMVLSRGDSFELTRIICMRTCRGGAGLCQFQDTNPKQFVLSVDDNTDFQVTMWVNEEKAI